jgi:hypothetical protein
MRDRKEGGVLLADFHIHTTWSDGKLSMGEVVNLFGRSGHDVIAITDHVVNRDNAIGAVTHRIGLSVSEGRFHEYLEEIEHERRRAWDRYRMIVLPGCELTRNTFRRSSSAHALAIGIDRFVSPEGSVEDMLADARAAGAAVVACHPNEQSEWFANTFYLWRRREEVSGLIDRWEIACRHDLFPPVSHARLPYIANSDFHDVPHLGGWKTLVPCEKNEKSVMEALKDGRDFAVTRLALEPRPGRTNRGREGLRLAAAMG